MERTGSGARPVATTCEEAPAPTFSTGAAVATGVVADRAAIASAAANAKTSYLSEY